MVGRLKLVLLCSLALAGAQVWAGCQGTLTSGPAPAGEDETLRGGVRGGGSRSRTPSGGSTSDPTAPTTSDPGTEPSTDPGATPSTDPVAMDPGSSPSDAPTGTPVLPGDGSMATWHRVGHRSMQSPAISDGAARPHSYFSVVAFDSGEVLPLNDWYHPQLMQYVPSSSALVSRAFMFPHTNMGNEDDIRWRIRAHKGATAAESLVFWHVMGWEEISDENGSMARDAAVFATRPIEVSPGVMPRAVARAVNMDADADETGVGPYRAGVDYDQAHRILFVSTDRSDRSVGHSIFQAYSVDPVANRFSGRAVASAPGPNFCQVQTFIRADSAHGLVLTQAENGWERERPILYLTSFAPGGDVATFGPVQQLEASGAGALGMPLEARDAVFAERDGHVFGVVAGRGLFVFDLGPVGGPYALGAPVAKIPLQFRAEGMQQIGDDLIVSSHGLEVFPIASVLAARGEASVAASVIRLPYQTYELDVATIAGKRTLFLASGAEGIDIFEGAAATTPATSDVLASTRRDVSLQGGPAQLVLETGHGLRTMSAPVMNREGDVAFWAVTEAGHEVIALLRADGTSTLVADTSRDPFRALGRPSLASGGRVAFWASGADGSQVIVHYSGALTELARTDGTMTSFDQPELSESGAVVFGRRDGSGAGSLVVRATSGTLATIFAEDDAWRLPYEDGEPVVQYDISPSGEVVFVKRRESDGWLVLSWWDGARTYDVSTNDREVNFPRMTESGVASYRSWGEEIIRLREVRAASGGGISAPTIVADRRSTYGGDFMFGNFQTSAELAADDIVFVAQTFAGLTLGPDELGSSLHRFTGGSESLPGILVATADDVDGAIVRNVLFADAAVTGQGAAFVLELERAGSVTYALTRLPL